MTDMQAATSHVQRGEVSEEAMKRMNENGVKEMNRNEGRKVKN